MPRSDDLRTALLNGAGEIGIVPVELDWSVGRHIVVGRCEHPSADLYVFGEGWSGGFSTSPIRKTDVSGSTLPFGPYVAACLAAGEVFKAVRMRPESYDAPSSAFYSMWNHRTSTALDRDGPASVSINVDFALAGVGAVGSAALHALWACDNVTGRITLADNDACGLESTNLNRYSLFGRKSVASAKAREAARIVTDASWECEAHDKAIEDLDPFPMFVLSAVDSNPSRAAIQNRYPSRILSASTHELRAESLRCGPPGIGALLAASIR